MVSAMSDIQSIVESFTSQLTAAIEAQSLAQARSVVVAALGGHGSVAKRRGRPPKNLLAAPVPQVAVAKVLAKTPRKKAPRQLCPVPGCKNPAAPILGMVCAKHKNVAKSKIKKYRETERRRSSGFSSSGRRHRSDRRRRP